MPNDIHANEDRFLFTCSGLDAGVFRVGQFSGIDTISSPYRFSITLTSLDPDIDGNVVINKNATLFLRRGDEWYPYSGIITSFKYSETTVDHSTYHVELQPMLRLLELTVQSRVFLKKSVPDIIEQVLKEAGLGDYYTLDVQSYTEREYVVQYQESDFNFLSRLMEECGIWYFFTENPLSLNSVPDSTSHERLVITDNGTNFKELPRDATITYRSKSGIVDRNDDGDKETVFRLECNHQLIPQEVIVKNYSYRTPETDLSLNKKITGGNKGKVYQYGGNYKDTSGAEKSATLIAHRYTMKKKMLDGSGRCSGFRSGTHFTLTEHQRQTMNAIYLLTRIEHYGTDPSFTQRKDQLTYNNTFCCIDAELADQFAPDCITCVPKIPGIMTALIEGNGSEYAALDDRGRYKVRMPFDRSDSENSMASKYVRLAQPYSGADYGIHFPSHEDAEMIVGHIDGNPDKPLGLGTVPNANTISPVKSSNQSTSVIRTAGKNEMVMDDMADAEKISFYTPKDMSFTVDHDHSETIKNDKTKTVEKNETNTIKGNRTNTVDGTFSETVKKNVTVTVTEGNETRRIEAGSLTAYVKSTVEETYDANQKTTVKGPIEIESKDKITITANTTLTLTCGQSKITLGSDGTIDITGVNVTVTAKSGLATIDGTDTWLKAKGLMQIEGANIDSAAKMSHTISGMMVGSDGKTVNVVKGGMVQLNPPTAPV